MSYRIVCYRVPKQRGRAYISGWKDHLGVYPVPDDEDLVAELEPYRHGKGTLWFGLEEPLPRDLIRHTLLALVNRD